MADIAENSPHRKRGIWQWLWRGAELAEAVAPRTTTFSTWEARFAPVTAHYVRVRALRRTTLHLAEVAVRHH